MNKSNEDNALLVDIKPREWAYVVRRLGIFWKDYAASVKPPIQTVSGVQRYEHYHKQLPWRIISPLLQFASRDVINKYREEWQELQKKRLEKQARMQEEQKTSVGLSS